MKNIFIILLLSMFGLGAFAQTLSPKATVTAGGEATGGGVTLSFTMGETYNSQLTGGGKILTEGVQQPEINLTTGAVNTSYCAGSSLDVPYTAAGYSDATNTFTAQISDASGSFANAVSIGTVTSISSGSISATIPNTASGAGYRIRVVSSKPSNIGSINTSDISVSTLGVTLTSNVIHPSCTEATGTITISATLSSLSYSIDGINYTNTTGIFSNVASGTYSVTAKNLAGCTSAGSNVVVNAQPAIPSAPTVNITHPTCTVSTGSIEVANATVGNTYSINGDDYSNTTGIFNNLNAGTYVVTVKSGATTCISPATTVVINVQPVTPAIPTTTVTQPTCTLATGTISVSSSLTGLTFSTDGIDYSNTNGIFIKSEGIYNVTAKNQSGCISSATISTVNAQPVTPASPTAVVTHPSCTSVTGSIQVSSSLTDLTFSINGSNYTNTTGLFTELSAGTYSLTARNQFGCISIINNNILNSQPPSPTTPTYTVTQPTCSATSTGTITITSSIANLKFSIDNLVYTNTSGIFSGLLGAYYTITSKNSYGCISPSTSVLVNSGLPAAPVTISDSKCGPGSVPISASAPAGCTIRWYDVPSGAGNAFFEGFTYNTYVINTTATFYLESRYSSGCVSATRTTVVAKILPVPTAPTVILTQPTVLVPSGTIKVTSSLTGLNFSYNNNDYTNSNGIFNGVLPGAYGVTSKNSSGCASVATNVVINDIPPIAPTAINGSRCGTGSVVVGGTAPSGCTVRWYDAATGGTYFYEGTSYNTYSIISTKTFYLESRSSSGLISANRTAVIATVNPIPTTPTITLTQPTVLVPTGTIRVTSSVTGLNFSINGIDYGNTNGVFSTLITGNYSVTSRNSLGCPSVAVTAVIKDIPPTVPVAISSSRCGFGSLTLGATVQSGCTVRWFDVASGGTSFFEGNTYNTYSLNSSITLYLESRNTASGLVSATRTPVYGIISTTTIPTAPTVTVTQPTVTVPSGTITVTSSVTGLTFSIDGTTYTNTTGIFTGLGSGSYNVKAKNACGNVSTATVAVVNAIPTSRLAYPTTDTTTIVKVDNVNANTAFDVNAFPNPTYTDFKLVLNSTSSESIKITVYNMLGRMVSTLTFNARQTLSIGNDLKEGTYMVEVRQGAHVKTLKLIKYR